MKFRNYKVLAAGALLALALQPISLFACAACYGASDSPMAKGMNWGIFSLLGVVAAVLGTIASFFVYIGKRSAAIANSQDTASEQKSESTPAK